MKTASELQRLLFSINRKGYPAYKDTKGSYQFDNYVLSIDHVQGDPFASPSKVSIHVSGTSAGFPKHLFDKYHKRIALQDHLTRLFYQKIEKYNFKAKGSGKSGLLSVSRCGQEILERTSCRIDSPDGSVIMRMEVGFPAIGRTIQSAELVKILFDFLPDCITSTLYFQALNKKDLEAVAALAEDQQYIREKLPEMGLAAFVANGSILPRESGISSLPMKQAVPFVSPKSLEVSLQLPHHGTITGMGIRKGVTLIIGGGYHGKSTLLKSLELGVYPHIAGDGREYVITDDTAFKLRSEDGRSIKKTDISMFIQNLPNKRDTTAFYTEDASGSTSQAANVVEAIESGTSLFLIDEDTSATNFMIRDELMQRVVHREQEPITPFIERVKELYEKFGISSIMVAGSSGSYFHVADCILQMDRYVPMEITDIAKKEAAAFPLISSPTLPSYAPDFSRQPKSNPSMGAGKRIKQKTLGKDGISLNHETIDLRYLEQLADQEQTTALSYMITYAEMHLFDEKKNLREIVETLYTMVHQKGLTSVVPGSYLPSNLALPRKQEIFACFNRYRGLKL